ncbi:putative P-loop containing nucleoside triphosphate hydrolase, leucine-rich repeat domain, L [Medicago truncatula]|uniref:LRR and NB-ARC domain disease resistance protein n=1 Tax=Medicago truncatula TaxID=3880 RepID=G7JBV1_MEDTR|nr:putative disease resistance protein At3g14460 [Medicago truncatula]XP_024633511.1 putative disease resistance protein At3g14460 [Medicago truncatula]AES71191.1 LRR and NB-ARC domain disease resistance protein [Medicago truncatula]RHN68427.1 putative P-loop containing nucleoside triphosphate hydrolase, leucine-rich repeat domain, L [Medicago truncatula]
MAEILGSFLSSLLPSKVDRISVQDFKDFFKGNGIDEGHLQDLRLLLLSVATVLNDAEEKQFIEPWVKEWTDKVKDVAYDADDLMDELVTKEMYSRDFASSLNPFAEQPQSRVLEILERLRSLVELKDILIIKEGSASKLPSFTSETTSLVDERRVYGRNVDKEKIIEFLLSNNSQDVEVPVVAIVGMAGVGKTTLAQILYNDSRVMDHFQSRSWASVSGNSKMQEITKQVLDSFTLCQSDVVDFNGLQIRLKKELTGKRFLLVLDGFENENYLDWDILQMPFVSENNGSRIIATTRNKRVATAIRANLTHFPPFLSQEASWELFSSHAFKSQNSNERSRVLTEIGKKIVQRCGGLPLATITLGSLLNSKEDSEEWENVCTSKLWDLSRGGNNIFSALISSYIRLPPYLKRCFSFCAIFPKGHKIEKGNLIYLWMAEGLLPRSTMGKRAEDIGEECFEELVSKTFFHHTSDDFLMHNIMHELAECVAGEFCYRLMDSDPSTIGVSRVRRISYFQGTYDDSEHFDMYADFEKLRTFMPFKFYPVVPSLGGISASVSTLLKKPKPLRVFSLSEYPITLLPSSIGHLLHLRYLDLSRTPITSLPDSICNLYNLEALLLVGCADLTLLPTKTSKLINLRQLDISGSGIKKMPTNLGKLKSLQSLPRFVVSNDGGSNVGELGEMLELRGSLSIVNLENVLLKEEASNAGLKRKKYLHEVEFKWTTPTHSQESENIIFDMLEPHRNLKRLKINNFGGEKFPNWLGSNSGSTMMSLYLDECGNCLSLPSLGQLSNLREIYITSVTRLQKVGPEFYGNGFEAFSSLRIIKFKDMLNWEEWSVNNQSGSEGFTLLQELYIENCPKLIGKLPGNLPSLDKLVITSCQTLSDTMPCVPRLRELKISGCEAFVSLSEQMMKCNDCLQTMAISNCPSLVSIPMDCVSGTLKSLKVSDCQKLQLEESHSYPVLESLILRSCDSLVSFQLALFPKLEDLCIEDCSSLQTILSTANNLPFLQNLNLKNCSKLAPFSEGEFSTMTSLNSLHLESLPTLTSLKGIGIEHLTSLKKLEIEDCGNLASLPIVASLFHLTVKGCPLLKSHFERVTGEYSDMVSSIPSTIIEA